MKLLEVAEVSHRYPTSVRPVLDNVNLDIASDGIVAVVGESGCGKTTLGKLVIGEAQPSEGAIRFDGRDIQTLKGKEFKAYRRAVQVVHQDPYASLNPGLTIEDTLGPAMLYHGLVRLRDLSDELVRLLQSVGLDATRDFLHRYPHQLSGGQRQRVAIARAMSLQPRLVVADEPTSMLDVSMRLAILDLLLSFQKEGKIAFVFISHDFGVVRYFAQGGDVAVMFYGVIVEKGPAEEVIHHPRHPYTYLLLQSIPVPNPRVARHRRQELSSEQVDGKPADTGCIFANRCPFVEAECRQARPQLREDSPGHLTACLFPERVPELTQILSGMSHAAAR